MNEDEIWMLSSILVLENTNTVLPWIVAGAIINFEPPSEGT